MKAFLTFFITACCLLVGCFVAQFAALDVNAADNELAVTVTELSADVGAYVKAGDYRVDFSITGNKGFATFGVGFNYGDDYMPVFDANDTLVSETPITNTFFVAVEHDETQNLVGVSAISLTNIYSDGIIFSFYVTRVNEETTSFEPPITGVDVDQMVSETKEEIEVVETYKEEQQYEVHVIETSYMIGDVDGDGVITQFDSQIALEIVEENGGTISAADFENDTPFYEYEGVICIGVVDVDGDNDIDDADCEEILRC